MSEVFVSTGATGTKAFTHDNNEAGGFTFSVRDAGGGGGLLIPVAMHHFTKNIGAR